MFVSSFESPHQEDIYLKIEEGGSLLNIRNDGLYYSFECVPSQYGLFFDCLQPHQAIFFALSIETFIGLIPVLSRSWEPSQ